MDKPTVFDQMDKAFPLVSAYAIIKKGEVVGKVAMKFPRDGAGRLTIFLHLLGSSPVRGTAAGYGYDKRSAAVANAARKLADKVDCWFATEEERDALLTALRADAGQHWDSAVAALPGFQCVQIV